MPSPGSPVPPAPDEGDPRRGASDPYGAGSEREDDESSTKSVLSDAANPYHRASDRWSRTPMIVALVLIVLIVGFSILALFDLVPGLGD